MKIMKRLAIRFLLQILNSRLLNRSPCSYEYVGNVDAFSIGHLESENRQRPGITVQTIIEEAKMFKCCPMRTTGITVIEDNVVREGTVWDEHELRNHFTSKTKQ